MFQIAEQQNTPENIRLLVAQARLYTEAKRIRLLRVVVSVILAAIAPVLAMLVPQSAWVMAALGGAWTLLTYFPFRGLQREKIRQAATIQEQFDVGLFNLPWNEVLVGSRVEPEIIHAAERSFREDTTRFRDWYSDTGSLPDPLNVLLCQRANIVWDWRLRRKYAASVAWLIAALLVVDVGIALVLQQSLLDFLLSLFFPSLPALVQGLETFLAHRETAAEKEELSHRIQALWDSGLREPQAVTRDQCRQIQDRIYALRKDGPLVPDRWYHWLRNNYQADMDATADQLRTQGEQVLVGRNISA